ncbi:hypothetical protein [Nonomuraea sp. NPDC005650]|uniref:hypothetical protein n=1 Tax=Nonomuraea sp. NPDC005650 TaxID=3157045 RepID=UPI0033B17133
MSLRKVNLVRRSSSAHPGATGTATWPAQPGLVQVRLDGGEVGGDQGDVSARPDQDPVAGRQGVRVAQVAGLPQR